MAINMKKLRKMAAKETVRQAKVKLLKMKKIGKKVDPESFEEYVKMLYENNLETILKKEKSKQKI